MKINPDVCQGPEYISEINWFSQRLRIRKFKIPYQILTMMLISFGFQNNMLQGKFSVILLLAPFFLVNLYERTDLAFIEPNF